MPNENARLCKTEAFLDIYKLLEYRIREAYGNDKSVLEYESMISAEDKEKLRMCRMIRNFLQHNPDAKSFVVVTGSMFEFMNSLCVRVLNDMKTAGKIAKKVKVPTISSNVKDICAWMLKYDACFAPVTDEHGKYVGFVDERMVKEMIQKSADLEGTSVGVFFGKKFSVYDTPESGFIVDKFRLLSTVDNSCFNDCLSNNGLCVVVEESSLKFLGIISRKAGNWS